MAVINCDAGVAEITEGSVHISPNPATAQLTIRIKNDEYSFFAIFNMVTVRNTQNQRNYEFTETTVNIQSLPPGFILYSSGRGRYREKVWKGL